MTRACWLSSGATGTPSASRVAYGLPNSLGFELFAREGAATFDLARAGEFRVVEGSPARQTNGYRQVLVGLAHPYMAEQVAGADNGLPPCPTFEAGLQNLRLLDAVAALAKSGGAEIVYQLIRHRKD